MRLSGFEYWENKYKKEKERADNMERNLASIVKARDELIEKTRQLERDRGFYFSMYKELMKDYERVKEERNDLSKKVVDLKKEIEGLQEPVYRSFNYIEHFNGIAIMPEVEAAEEEPEKDRGNGLAPIAELKKKLADEIVEKCF